MTLVPGESAADRWSLIMDHGFNPACGCCLVFSQGGFYWFGVCLTWLLDIQKAHPFCLWHHLLLSLSFLSLLITPVGGPISNLSISYSFRSIEHHLIVSNSRASDEGIICLSCQTTKDRIGRWFNYIYNTMNKSTEGLFLSLARSGIVTVHYFVRLSWSQIF